LEIPQVIYYEDIRNSYYSKLPIWEGKWNGSI
jgi:hypothetical protein